MGSHVWMVTALVVVAVVVRGAEAGADTSVCTPVASSNATGRPVIPDVFRVSVECNLLERNQTTYVREYYDYNNNKGKLRKTDPLYRQDIIYDYPNNDIVVIDPDQGTCKAGALILTPDKFVFGYTLKNYQSQILSPSLALHFQTGYESYSGPATVRGIAVDKWSSCEYMPSLNATANVIWYFSSKDAWDEAVGRRVAVPVRMTAIGKYINQQGQSVPFNHQYEFFDFEDGVRSDEFTIPDGVYCEGRMTKGVTFPTLPDYFSFTGEAANPYELKLLMLEENYDNLTRLTEYKFKIDNSHLTDLNRYSEFNDYNTGASYVMDRRTGQCSTTSIKQGAVVFSKNVNGQDVRMETPREFFQDKNIQYQYSGQKPVRGVMCDRWVGTTSQARGYEGKNVTVEWFFATTDYHTWNTAVDLQGNPYRIPMLYRLFLPQDVASDSMNFHIFYFNSNEPPLASVDIGSCFSSDRRKQSFRFSISNTYVDTVRANLVQTKQSIRNAISLFTGIGALRVANIKVYFGDTVHVTFDMLDKPTFYNDVAKAVPENTLDAAAGLLAQTFASQAIAFDVAAGTQVKHVKPDYTSLEDVTIAPFNWNNGGSTLPPGNTGANNNNNNRPGATTPRNNINGGTTPAGSGVTGQYGTTTPSDAGYTGGALAGLGVAMFIVGGAGGAGGAFVFFK